MKILVKNNGKRPEGIRTTDGLLKWVKPGHQGTFTVAEVTHKALTRIKELSITVKDGEPAPAPAPSPIPASPDADLIAALGDDELVHAIEDRELRDFIERRSGEKPHHALGRVKLLEQARTLAVPAPVAEA